MSNQNEIFTIAILTLSSFALGMLTTIICLGLILQFRLEEALNVPEHPTIQRSLGSK